MYWWNASKLAEDLREGRVDEKERFKYFLATVALWILAVKLLPFPGGASGVEAWISAAVNVTAAFIGISLCYMVNKRGDNRDFIARMICLGWPAGIKFAVLFSVFFLGIACIESLPSAALGAKEFLSDMANTLRRIRNMYLATGLLSIFILAYCSAILGHVARLSNPELPESLFKGKDISSSPGKILLGILGGIGIPFVIMISAIGLPGLDIDSMPGKLLAFLPILIVLLLCFGPTFIYLLRSPPKHPR